MGFLPPLNYLQPQNRLFPYIDPEWRGLESILGALPTTPSPHANALRELAILGSMSAGPGSSFLPRFGVPESQPTPVAPVNQLLALAPPKRRVFTSFQTEDLWVAQQLRRVSADPMLAFEIYDESLREPFDSADADYIRAGIRRHIERSSVTICLIGPTTHQSLWVDFELFESAEKGNRIIPMVIPGGPTTVVAPRLLRQMEAPIWAWNLDLLHEKIVSAPKPVPHR